MNFPSQDIHSFWDISQQPDTFSALPDDDFLAFLQKQFPGTVGSNQPLSFDNPDGVDPQSITNFPPPNLSPASSDSSPSPPSTHNESSLSRRQSGVFNGIADPSQEDSSLKRKASTDADDEPQHKSHHASSSAGGSNKKTTSSASARRKPGAPQDETRLLKRKEQNRAAQRAFRERKEKHVRDLEDKVAQLEAKNQLSEQENENLRDLLSRLQNENMMLKQAAFTFSAPRGNANAAPQGQFNNLNNHPMQFNFSSPGAGPSRSPVQAQSPPTQNGLNFNSLISFDPSMLNVDDYDTTMADAPFSYAANHYKTIASNPMCTSFAEPSPADSPPLMMNGGGQQPFNHGAFEFGSDHWTPPEEAGQDALDQLFNSTFLTPNNTSTVDFQALLASPPSTLSPVSHRTPSLTSSSSSPGANSGSPSTTGNSPAGVTHGTGDCPKTKEQLSKVIAESGQSSFVQSPSADSSPASDDKMNVDHGHCAMPFAPFLKKATGEDGGTPFVMCRGSSFPKTQKSDKNVEVLTAWRTITSNPQFKDVDINELCTEFTNKARCDGTKVVLEPEGVHHIIETLAARQAQSQSKQ
ncbi:hypothetical protein L227DRAFT_160821 [Lentinus tigrinus ALCF2SS1-6]|uniref:BZIP domain-containing protein n=1 Tax=Lentinus tigrinus ALCF2SS1-6 TaxID=1328759 RepID=A0A5C2S6G6_9APHY|nr:hypothetical protein L227DRAFT_160821 [Lentinus tigrinus ALCF2SS1-6]